MGNALPCQGLRGLTRNDTHNEYTTSEGMTEKAIPSVLEIWDWNKKSSDVSLYHIAAFV